MKIIKENEKKRNHKGYIKFFEREIIEKMDKQHVSHRKIGKILGRGKSTISDEINRYKTHASWFDAVRDHIRNHPSSSGGGNIVCDYSVGIGSCVNTDTGRACYPTGYKYFSCADHTGFTLSNAVHCKYEEGEGGTGFYKTLSCLDKISGNICSLTFTETFHPIPWRCVTNEGYSIN